MDKLIEGYLDFLENVNVQMVEHVEKLHFEAQHPWHRHYLMLYGTILELTDTVCLLLREGKTRAVPTITRGLLEAHADFVNLGGDSGYVEHINASFYSEQLRLLREQRKGENPFLGTAPNDQHIDDEILLYERLQNELKVKGYRPLSNSEKFDRAGQKELYGSVYRQLCCHSHNNLMSLISHHVSRAESQDTHGLSVLRAMTPIKQLTHIDTFCGVAITTSLSVHRLSGSSAVRVFEALNDKCKQHRLALTSQRIFCL